jgi:hypothetical protein
MGPLMAIHTSSKIGVNIDKIIADLTTDKVVKVGWVKGNRYPENQGGKYVAEIAAQNEYGAPHKAIPARPFMAPAVANNQNEWISLAGRGLKKVLKGDLKTEDVLDAVGVRMANDVVKAIKAVTSPPLAPITIANRLARYASKGNKKKINPTTLEKPLVDTALMIDSVTSSVEAE